MKGLRVQLFGFMWRAISFACLVLIAVSLHTAWVTYPSGDMRAHYGFLALAFAIVAGISWQRAEQILCML